MSIREFRKRKFGILISVVKILAFRNKCVVAKFLTNDLKAFCYHFIYSLLMNSFLNNETIFLACIIVQVFL